MIRGRFNEIESYPEWVKKLVDSCERAGVYERGIESDRKKRGSAINVDCYGYDESQGVAVIQVRECIFRPGRFNKVRKDYYLIGHTEQGNPFAHPIDSPCRSKKIQDESAEATVRRVLAGIWQCDESDLADIVRQGDVAFVPARLPRSAKLLAKFACVYALPFAQALTLREKFETIAEAETRRDYLLRCGQRAEAVIEYVREITIRETHKIVADRIFKDGKTFYVARAAAAIHTKRQHATVRVKNGFYRVAAGYRAQVWGFSRPMGD